MSGHSKWANIKHKKAKQDEKRGKAFTKLGRELIIAARQGGADPETNARLKAVVQKAREANMPAENIARNIQRGAGLLDGANFEEVLYEGYGPGGIAVLLEIATDNRNRTASEIRYLFSRNGGNLGESGCVAWMFSSRGLIEIEIDPDGKDKIDVDELMLLALEAGAEDVQVEEQTVEILTDPREMESTREALVKDGYEITRAEVTMVASNSVAVEDPNQARQLLRLMDVLEDHDDVQAVYANFDIADAILQQLDQE